MMQRKAHSRALLLGMASACFNLPACVESSKGDAGGSGGTGGSAAATMTHGAQGGSGGTVPSETSGVTETLTFSEGAGLNQCGVAAPLPVHTGACSVVTNPLLADFDDYKGGAAEGYEFFVEAGATDVVRGALLHVGDGSDVDAESVIATEMVPGAGDTGYALRFSNTHSVNWGGLLMLYFPGSETGACLDTSRFGGVEFSIRGSTPSGRVGVTLGMLDTVPVADGGLCDNATADDCHDPTLSVRLPSDAEAWTRVQVPFSAFTPGVGSESSCVPNTGANIVRLVIQPFMNYAPPNWEFEPGPYSLTVDDVRLYGTADSSDGLPDGTGGDCDFPQSPSWTASEPIIYPLSDEMHDLVAVKDPSVVRFEDRWHVFASSVSTTGAYNLVYTSFESFDAASTAPLYYMDQTPGFDTYVAAPQLFYFTPHEKWYLVFQSGPPMYSTNDDLSDPTSWTSPQPFYRSTPAIVDENGGGWLDYWVICDDDTCHLFFSSNQGRFYRSETSKVDFPEGFGDPVVVMENSNAGRIFEGSNVYEIVGTNQYVAIIEAFDQTSDDRRYFRSWLAESLRGPWLPWQASGSYPFAGARNVVFDGAAWTEDISHGEMVRLGHDETLGIDPCNMQYLFQGADPTAETGGDYNAIPWHLGLLSLVQ